MDVTQEFLVPTLERDGVLIYGVRDFPSGTAIGRDAQRIRIVGPVWVRPPRPELTEAQWENWQAQLRVGRLLGDGRTVLDVDAQRSFPAAGGRA